MTKHPSATASRTLAEAEREHILDVLKQTDWLIGGRHGAVARLGLPRTTLVYKMRKLGIEARRSHQTRFAEQKTSMLARATPGGLGSGNPEPVAAF
jgi:hypothetical protein